MRFTFPAATLTSLFIMSSCSISPFHNDFPVSQNKVLAKHDLIEVSDVDRTIHIELVYKTSANLTKAPLYQPQMPALLRPETAQRLAQANTLVGVHGYRLKIWDAYRPPEAQIRLWDASGHNDLYVANPYNKPSQHSCGTAVDVTLCYPDGKPVPMPTGFDDFTAAANCNAVHPDPVVRANLRILQEAMKGAGFYLLTAEWWHFIDGNYQKYPETIAWEDIRTAF